MLDRKQSVIAAIHAGWRGTSARITSRAIQLMISTLHCMPEDMIAFIGPSAGGCCYEVGSDVAEMFSKEFVAEREERLFVDLKAANVAQLVDAGLSDDAIEVSKYCTIEESALFHSFRRDRERSGRMFAVIALRPIR
jgi:YfiH family protein